jgi:hypothetical protein
MEEVRCGLLCHHTCDADPVALAASITCASAAIAAGGIEMKDLVAGCSLVRVRALSWAHPSGMGRQGGC